MQSNSTSSFNGKERSMVCDRHEFTTYDTLIFTVIKLKIDDVAHKKGQFVSERPLLFNKINQ